MRKSLVGLVLLAGCAGERPDGRPSEVSAGDPYAACRGPWVADQTCATYGAGNVTRLFTVMGQLDDSPQPGVRAAPGTEAIVFADADGACRVDLLWADGAHGTVRLFHLVMYPGEREGYGLVAPIGRDAAECTVAVHR